MTTHRPAASRFALRIASLPVLAALLLALAGCAAGGGGGTGATNTTWGDAKLVRPADLVAQLADTSAARPLLVHVGVRVLYRAGAIPGSVYAGPGSDPGGIDAMLAAVRAQPKDGDIVIYCGCCPAVNCPNMKPAFAALRDAGYTKVRALWIEKNFDTDWADHGYPTEKPAL